MTENSTVLIAILADAVAHRHDCQHIESGELLETLLATCLTELVGEGRDMSSWYEWLATKGVEIRAPLRICKICASRKQSGVRRD